VTRRRISRRSVTVTWCGGVCSLFIADKLGVSQPTCGEHLKILSRAGLIRGTKIKQWVFYQRDEARIAAAKELLSSDW
jgi:DNA-binding transcriptional ArsR family regulator